MGNFPTPLFFSGSACTVESREESVVEEFSESEFDDDVVEGESSDSWESESNAKGSLYIPTPMHLNKAHPIDLPNWGNL